MKRLLLLMLAPTACLAQEVHSVTSQDYLKLIRSDSSRSRLLASDTAYNLQYSKLRTSNNYPGPVRTVVVKSQDLSLTPLVQKLLVFSGNFSTTVEVKQVNQTPALQNEYSQGRSLNGQATWQGPETREVFSFGPLMSELEYDGAGYAYDRNGRLVPAANGNGKKAVKYKNDIFRTGLSTAQFLSVQGRYLVARKQLLAATLRVGRRGESHFMRGNKSRANSLMASVERSFKQHTATASFNQFEEHYTAGNGIGFLSRLYQNALLTPVSFDNSQGSRIGSLQRSYGAFSDNPLFLLEKGSPIMKSNRSAGLQFERKNGQLQYKVSQSLEISRENSGEGYEAGAAFFPSGIAMIRNLRQRSHLTKAKLQYKPQLNISNLHTTISASYIGSWDQSLILYAPGNDYQYKRSSHQLGLSYSTRLERRNFDAGLNLDNNTYSSSTSSVRDLFIPGISGFVMLNTPGPLSIKLSGSAIALNSEPALGNSFRGASLLQYTTADAFEYFPRIEASSVDNLMPIRHRDHAAAIELRYGHKFSLRAEVFSRSISGDVMPVLEGGELLLKNLADHSNTGQEIQLSFLSLKSKLSNAHSLSFFSYRSKVTAAAPGYDGTPLAGFSDVHKAVVQGEAFGVIRGSRFLRDGAGNRIIGADGFPLADPVKGVIGNPIPDFVVKMNNSTSWKMFTLNLDWEWKKGGDVWNGTQAVLDYYGRSENSARLRGTTGYVFEGVRQDGHPNTQPVRFYDEGRPVTDNRWTRYGHGGIAEEYIEKGDHLRLNNIGLSCKLKMKKYLKSMTLTAYVHNLMIWTAYDGADPDRLLQDQPGTQGLDFFNIPTAKTFGFNMSIQF